MACGASTEQSSSRAGRSARRSPSKGNDASRGSAKEEQSVFEKQAGKDQMRIVTKLGTLLSKQEFSTKSFEF